MISIIATTSSTSTVQKACLIFTEPGMSSATEPQLQSLQCSLPLDVGADDSPVQTQDLVVLTNPQLEHQILTVESSQKAPGSKKRKRETKDEKITEMHLAVHYKGKQEVGFGNRKFTSGKAKT